MFRVNFVVFERGYERSHLKIMGLIQSIRLQASFLSSPSEKPLIPRWLIIVVRMPENGEHALVNTSPQGRHEFSKKFTFIRLMKFIERLSSF